MAESQPELTNCPICGGTGKLSLLISAIIKAQSPDMLKGIQQPTSQPDSLTETPMEGKDE